MRPNRQLPRQHWNRWKKGAIWLTHVIIRPFFDFYYNYGFARASVLSYVLCANLVIYAYLLSFGAVADINPFRRISTGRRFLELNFLWPFADKKLIKEAPPTFEINPGRLVSEAKFQAALQHYRQKYGHSPGPKLIYEPFSITEELAKTFCYATVKYYERFRLPPLGLGLFIIIAIAVIAMLLSIKTNLAELASPFIWGNLPLASRHSELKKLLWRLPSWEKLVGRFKLFVMLPVLIAIFIPLLAAVQDILDEIFTPYLFWNTATNIVCSLAITTTVFGILYRISVPDLSRTHAYCGAFIASILWLVGRWLFTTYAAVSLVRNLRNFAIIPIFLSWFYYLSALFLLGLHIAHTLENPHLSYTARCWVMRDISNVARYNILSLWIRLEFLLHLAKCRSEGQKPPFIGIRLHGDVADELAKATNLSPSFVRESISEMVVRNPKIFRFEVEGRRQFVTLAAPPEEVDIVPLLIQPEDSLKLLEEIDYHPTACFAIEQLGPSFIKGPIYLSELRAQYRRFLKNSHDSQPAITEFYREEFR